MRQCASLYLDGLTGKLVSIHNNRELYGRYITVLQGTDYYMEHYRTADGRLLDFFLPGNTLEGTLESVNGHIAEERNCIFLISGADMDSATLLYVVVPRTIYEKEMNE